MVDRVNFFSVELNTNGNPVNCIIRHRNNESANLKRVTSVKEEPNESITVRRRNDIVYRAARGTWQSVEIMPVAEVPQPAQSKETPYDN